LIAAAVVFFLREPLIFGKSFCIVEVAKYTPWKAYRVKPRERANNACNDQLFAHYPRKVIYHQSVRSGDLPQWSSKMMGGYPIAADPHFAWYDPFSLIFAIFSVDTALKFFGFLQWLLGGLFAYLFLREIGLGRMAGVVGGVAFAAQPFFITHLAMTTNPQSAMWLPYLLWIFERMMKSPGPGRYIPAMALGAALSILGGFPPAFILVLAGFLFYGICRIIFRSDDAEAAVGRRATAIALVASVIIGAMLSGPQLLPTYGVSKFSERKSIPYEQHKKVSLPVEFLVTLADPYILGRPTREGWKGFAERIRPGAGEWVSPTSFHENSHYVGWAVLLLAVWALRFGWKERRVKIMAATAALAILTLYGSPTLRLAYHLVPGFSSARPDRIIFIWGSFLAFLAGVGFNELLNVEAAERRRFAVKLFLVVLAISVILAVASFTVRFSPDWIKAHVPYSRVETGRLAAWKYMIAFAVTYAPTWTADALFSSIIAALSALLILAATWRHRIALVLFLVLIVDADLMAGRYLTFQPRCYPRQHPAAIEYLINYGWDRRVARFGKQLRIFPPNSPLIWGLSDAQGRQALTLRHWGRYFDGIERGTFRRRKKVDSFKNPQSLASPLISAAGIKYLLSDVPNPFPPSVKDQWKLVHAGDLFIYENLRVFPEAWVATEAETAADEQEAARLIVKPGFDPAVDVVIEGPVKTSIKGAGGSAEVIRHSPEMVEVKLSESSSGWLVLADTWYPVWRVEVDGKPRKLWKADLAFMAVRVEDGDRTVVFRYRDIAVPIGRLIAAIGAVGCLLIWMVSRKRAEKTAS